jgi:[ribosomal protein S18]-alanine N-acetyltransferase
MMQIAMGNGLDVPAIMPVMDNAFDPAFSEAWTAAQCLSTLSLPHSQLIVARWQGQVAGFTLSRWAVDEEELLLIGVAKYAQRQGVGAGLINKLISNAQKSQRASVFLEVRHGNSARSFYEMMGFKPVGIRPGYYRAKDGSLHDSVTMAIQL